MTLWSLATLVTAGPVALVVEDLGWIPPIALVVSVPLLLIGATGALLAPRRAPVEGADGPGPPLRS